MPNITFSSPLMHKDVTVYAPAGGVHSILQLAKMHKVPLPFECGDGNCGSCVIKVTNLSPGHDHAQHLTEKEKATLLAEGFVSRATLREIEDTDMPPSIRLSCQYIPVENDILIEFSGDAGVPFRN
jgi:ferredoxin